MKQTMLLKLVALPEQQTALLETMQAFNAACNEIAQTAFDEKLANKFELEKMVYGDIRKRFTRRSARVLYGRSHNQDGRIRRVRDEC